MATGSGTGTPASSSGSATLTSLRSRVLTQVTAAAGGPVDEAVTKSSLTLSAMRERVRVELQLSGRSSGAEVEVATASGLTLTTLRDRVEIALQDSGNVIWATGDLDEAIRQALEQYSRVRPQPGIATITLASTGREIDISSVSGLLRVEKVWCPYDSSSPSYPPNWRNFRVWPGSILFVDDSDEPQSGEKIRVWYTKEQALSGLDSATSTTFPIEDEAFIVAGAAAFAARFRAIEIAEQANVDAKVFDRLQGWADKAMAEFEEGLRSRRRAIGGGDYDEDALDEAIRQAVELYSRYKPDEAITTVALTANGREIDISSVSGLVRVVRVWWDYDSSSPGHPPNWRHFEVWPGGVLYVDDQSTPQSGDVVRIWYTKEQTLNGLDGASATTFPVDDEGFLVSGAAALAARFTAARKVGKGDFSHLVSWADAELKWFRRGLWTKARLSYAYAYDQDDLDEAIRWALARYTEVSPDVAIATVTLGSSGREVDISSITDYLEVQRVWWDYDSSDPEYPPEWCDFETWPGDILFIDSESEPQSGDVVRIWYTKKRAVSGLDGASETTLPDEDETLVVVGASGFVAQERVQEEDRRSVPRKLREWAEARLREFERGLAKVARRQAAKYSGVTGGPRLDRWDVEGKWG